MGGCGPGRPATVWRYWTDPERVCDWWGASAELDPRPGGICVVRLGGDAVMRGKFVELIPYRRIVFTLGWEPADGAPPVAPGSTTVTITLAEDDGGAGADHYGATAGAADP